METRSLHSLSAWLGSSQLFLIVLDRCDAWEIKPLAVYSVDSMVINYLLLGQFFICLNF